MNRYVGELGGKVTPLDVGMWRYKHGGVDISLELIVNTRTKSSTLILRTVEP
jgi:hypothetical protein